VLVLHYIEPGALEDVIDRERVMAMRLQTFARVENSHADQCTRRSAMRLFGIVVNKNDETPISARYWIAGDFLELGEAIFPVPTSWTDRATDRLWVPLVVAHQSCTIEFFIEL